MVDERDIIGALGKTDKTEHYRQLGLKYLDNINNGITYIEKHLGKSKKKAMVLSEKEVLKLIRTLLKGIGGK